VSSAVALLSSTRAAILEGYLRHFLTRIVALLCVVSCATLAAIERWPAGQRVRTSDRNGDGRPDVWNRYDARGQLTEIDRDTNFDGTPDVQEYYQRGVLIRRESDRNFNGQADLVEEFDPDTQGQIRSVVDIDYDGIADLLVLFRDGQPVFSKHIDGAHQSSETSKRHPAVHGQGHGDRLAAMLDPFAADLSVRRSRIVFADAGYAGLSTSGGLPLPRFTLLGRLAASARVVTAAAPLDALTIRLPHASRAPPVS